MSEQLNFDRLKQQLIAIGENAPSLDEKLALLAELRQGSRLLASHADRFLLSELEQTRQGLLELRELQERIRKLHDELTAPPWHPALFLETLRTTRGPTALVQHGASRRLVAFGEGLEPESFGRGDEVLLGNTLGLIVARAPSPLCRAGETAIFERYTDDGRLVLKVRDEEVVALASHSLSEATLRQGDGLRWDRTALVAFERLDRSRGESLFLEETPQESFAAVGGLDDQIERLKRSVQLHLNHPELVRRYGLRRRKSVLLVGPPGTGKTLLARALAHWLAEVSASGRSRFMNVKPGSLHSVWYSRSEANYREAFRVAREAGDQEPDVPVVMFFDEIDAIGSSRGESLMRVDDRVLAAFLAELNGLEGRGNVLVVAATNRADALDPALLRPGRLGDAVLEVPRPNRRAAREIFGKHLSADIPYAAAATADPGLAREDLIESAVSRLYAPNAAVPLATLTLRDGTRHPVRPSDLLSGASIAQMCAAASERAVLRELETGEAGLRRDDLLRAIDAELEVATSVLQPWNCRRHLSGLPQDVDVVRIDRARALAQRGPRPVRVA